MDHKQEDRTPPLAMVKGMGRQQLNKKTDKRKHSSDM